MFLRNFWVLILSLCFPWQILCRERKTENGRANRTDGGRSIRVLFYNNPPDAFSDCHHFPYLKVSSMRCRFPGHCVENLMQIVNFLGLKVDPVIDHSHFLGGYINGTPTGLLSLLANRSVDSICKLFTRTNNNSKIFDFTRTIYSTWSGIAVRRHPCGQMYKWDMWSLFHPFTESTWLAIGIMLLIWMTLFPMTNLIESKIATKKKCEGIQILWRMFRLQLQQPDDIRFCSVSGNFSFFLFGLLHVMLFCSLYQSWIVTTLISGQRLVPFQSLEELIPLLESGRYKFAALPTNHWFFETVESSNDPRHIRIRNAMRKYPLEVYEDESQVLKLVQSGTHVAIVQGGSTLEWVANSFCEVVFVRGGMPEKAIHFAFAKGSTFVKMFNEAIGHEAVFMHRKRWKYEYYTEKQRERFCLESDRERKRFKPLGLIPFLGPCVVLLFGNAIALVAFSMETIVHFFTRNNIRKSEECLRKQMEEAIRAENLCTDNELFEMKRRKEK
ncbi:hypothetical protein niasHT_013512 [Heterodera trifolii]|uniref:Glutamate receptor n=1 Tax=Heterodera trifolii TaxID=157864 RepID=A0ABD2LCT4_9BILA